MATGRLPDPNTAPVTAKGDLYTYSTVPAKLAVGSNGETLVADSSATTGLRWQGSFAAGKNRLINGAMTVYQRGGFSGALAAGTAQYGGPDRWFMGIGSGTTTVSCTQISASLTGFDKALRAQRASGQTNTGAIYVMQQVETANLIPLQNQTIVISFWARAGANYSSASSALIVSSSTGTGTDEAAWSGLASAWTGWANQLNSSVTLTTSWQKFSVSYTMPSTATEANFGFYYTPVGTAGAADYFDVTGVQVEIGSVATGFTPASGTLAGELAACQRYYWRTTANNLYSPFGQGNANTTTGAYILINHPVEMRTVASSVDYSTLAIGKFGNAVYAVSSVSLADRTKTLTLLSVGMANTGYGANDYCQLSANNSTSAYVALNAEL